MAEGSSIFPTNNRDPLYLSFMKNINGLSIRTSLKSENDNGTKSIPENNISGYSISLIDQVIFMVFTYSVNKNFYLWQLLLQCPAY